MNRFSRQLVPTILGLCLSGCWCGCDKRTVPNGGGADPSRSEIVSRAREHLKPQKSTGSDLGTPSSGPELDNTAAQTNSAIHEQFAEPEHSLPGLTNSVRPLPADILVLAQQGNPVAQRQIGQYYGEQGLVKESNEWFLKAALQGDARAQYMMGVHYTFGMGVELNPQEAGKWFLLAAEQGDAEAQYSVGLRWARGEAGEPQDLAEASKWFRLAAEQGVPAAQLSLGRRYANGEGVPKDYVEAYKWMWLGVTRGTVPDAERVLKRLANKMTPEQINYAKLLAQGFQPKPPAPFKNQERQEAR
jgi:TPR repeat protein